jgi:MFS family permease
MLPGFLNIVSSVGSVIGGPLGGLLADTIGWRWEAHTLCAAYQPPSNSLCRCFLFQVPVAAVAFASVAILLRVPSPEKARLQDKLKRVDFAGSFCLIVSLATLLVALDSGGDIGWNKPRTLEAFAVFAAFLAMLALIETKIAKEPVAPPSVVASLPLLPIYLSNFAARGCSMCFIFFISLYVQAVLRFTSAQAGIALLPSIFGDVMGSVLGGGVIQLTGRTWWPVIVAHGVMILGSGIIVMVTMASRNNSIAVLAGLEGGRSLQSQLLNISYLRC